MSGCTNNHVWVGMVLTGICNEYFGEDWGDKIIEAIGRDWIVARGKYGPVLAEFKDHQDLHACVNQWVEDAKSRGM